MFCVKGKGWKGGERGIVYENELFGTNQVIGLPSTSRYLMLFVYCYTHKFPKFFSSAVLGEGVMHFVSNNFLYGVSPSSFIPEPL
jgi:hypothetical protein